MCISLSLTLSLSIIYIYIYIYIYMRPILAQAQPAAKEACGRARDFAEPHARRGVEEFKRREPREQMGIAGGGLLLLIFLIFMVTPSAAAAPGAPAAAAGARGTRPLLRTAPEPDGAPEEEEAAGEEAAPAPAPAEAEEEAEPPAAPQEEAEAEASTEEAARDVWIRGNYGLAKCPEGSTGITDAETCESAVKSLQKEFTGPSRKYPRPQGCFARLAFGLFNSAQSYGSDKMFYPVCKCNTPCQLSLEEIRSLFPLNPISICKIYKYASV